MDNNQFYDDEKSEEQKDIRATCEDMQKMIALHIWKNDHLREEILANPKETLERDLKVKFDEHIKLNIVNHKYPNEVTFILPYNIKAIHQDLSDDDLEQVAGGAGGIFSGLIGGIAKVAGANQGQLNTIAQVTGVADTVLGIGLGFR